MGAYFSGIVILLANCQYYPTHEMARQDHKLARDGMKLLQHLIQIKQDDQFDRGLGVLSDLDLIASQAISHYQGNAVIAPKPPLLAQESYSMSDDFFNLIGDEVSKKQSIIHAVKLLINNC